MWIKASLHEIQQQNGEEGTNGKHKTIVDIG